jgi:hypothetical protein
MDGDGLCVLGKVELPDPATDCAATHALESRLTTKKTFILWSSIFKMAHSCRKIKICFAIHKYIIVKKAQTYQYSKFHFSICEYYESNFVIGPSLIRPESVVDPGSWDFFVWSM